jgi:hypothetical protein
MPQIPAHRCADIPEPDAPMYRRARLCGKQHAVPIAHLPRFVVGDERDGRADVFMTPSCRNTFQIRDTAALKEEVG